MPTVYPEPLTAMFSASLFTGSVSSEVGPEPADVYAEIVGSVYEGGPMATKTINFTLEVTTPPDWFLAIAPTNLSVARGSLATFNVTATAQGGYAGSITLSVLGLPAGVVPTFTVNPISENGTTAVSIPTENIPVGTLALTLQGTTA